MAIHIPDVNGKVAVRIKAEVKKKLACASLIDAEGDKVFIPNACIRDNNDGTIDIQEWIYKKEFQNK